MKIGFEIIPERTAAKPKAQAFTDDAPRQLPMRPHAQGQIKPSTDQLKARRQMAKNRKSAIHIDSDLVCPNCTTEASIDGMEAPDFDTEVFYIDTPRVVCQVCSYTGTMADFQAKANSLHAASRTAVATRPPCPNCGAEIGDDWMTCPNCLHTDPNLRARHDLDTINERVGQEPSWVEEYVKTYAVKKRAYDTHCPYCGMEGCSPTCPGPSGGHTTCPSCGGSAAVHDGEVKCNDPEGCGYGWSGRGFEDQRHNSSKTAVTVEVYDNVIVSMETGEIIEPHEGEFDLILQLSKDEEWFGTDPTYVDKRPEVYKVGARTAARSDYDHLNEDADHVWWMEEGRHGSEEPEYDDFDIDDRDFDPDEDEDDEDAETTYQEPAGDFHAMGSNHMTDISRQREANILRALSSGRATLEEQRRLVADLEDLRARRKAAKEASRSVALADAIVREAMTPALTHTLTTASTDWLGEISEHADGDTLLTMRTEAQRWHGRVHTAVKEDRDEFCEQARGMARHTASRYGFGALEAKIAFLGEIARISGHRFAEVDDWEKQEQASGEITTAKDPRGRPIDPSAQGTSTLPTPEDNLEVFDNLLPAIPAKDDKRPEELRASRRVHAMACPECKGEGTVLDGYDGVYDTCETCKGKGTVSDTVGKDATRRTASDWEDFSSGGCPACGQPIDYCQGHGEIGDPEGAAILERHDDGDHGDCHPQGCDEAGGHTAKRRNQTTPRRLHHQGANAYIDRDFADAFGFEVTASEPIADESGQARSGLPNAEEDEDDDEAFPWELDEDGGMVTGDGRSPSGAADVANVPTPGGEAGYPQPKKKSGRTAAHSWEPATMADLQAGDTWRWPEEGRGDSPFTTSDENWSAVLGDGPIGNAAGQVSRESFNGRELVRVDSKDGNTNHGSYEPSEPIEIARTGRRVVASDTCTVCGDSIARDPEGEKNRTWHHTNGTKHDHEASPSSGNSSEAKRLAFRQRVQASLKVAR